MSLPALPTKDKPLNFPVKEQEITDDSAYFASGNRLIGIDLLLGVLILGLIIGGIIFLTAEVFMQRSSNQRTTIIAVIVMLSVALWGVGHYFTTRLVIHQSVFIDFKTKEIELKNRFVRGNEQWFYTNAERIPLSKVSLVQFRIFPPFWQSVKACAELKILKRKSIQLTYGANDSKAKSIVEILDKVLSTIEKEKLLIESKSKPEKIETDIVSIAIESVKGISIIPVLIFVLILIFGLMNETRDLSVDSMLLLASLSGVCLIFRKNPANMALLPIYSLWLFPMYGYVIDDLFSTIIFMFWLSIIPSYKVWTSYRKIKRNHSSDPRFRPRSVEIAEWVYPIIGIALSIGSLVLVLFTPSPFSAWPASFAEILHFVQIRNAHIAMISFAFIIASLLSGYRLKFASVAGGFISGYALIIAVTEIIRFAQTL